MTARPPGWRFAPLLTATTLLLFTSAAEAAAQTFGPRGIFSVEARGGLAAPTEDFREIVPQLRAEPGVTLGGDLMANLTRQITAYAGYSWTMFDCDGALCLGDAEFTSSGFDAGLKFLLPLDGTVLPWVRAGALFHRLRYSSDLGSVTSNRPIGLDSAVGADIALGRRASLTPAIRYNRYTVEVDGAPLGSVERTVSFFNLDLAFHFFVTGA